MEMVQHLKKNEKLEYSPGVLKDTCYLAALLAWNDATTIQLHLLMWKVSKKHNMWM